MISRAVVDDRHHMSWHNGDDTAQVGRGRKSIHPAGTVPVEPGAEGVPVTGHFAAKVPKGLGREASAKEKDRAEGAKGSDRSGHGWLAAHSGQG